MKTVDIRGYDKYYTISENGDVYSKRLGRMIKPSIQQPYGYYKIVLTGDLGVKTWGVHQLVLRNFVCDPPVGKECHHIDHDKGNNHVDNLEWVTHQENILRSFTEGGRVGFWKGKERGAFRDETLEKMALAKWKPVRGICGDDVIDFESIGACAEHFNTYREKIYRYLRGGRPLDGYYLQRL